MLTEKQSRFIKHLLSKKGYHSEDWKWLSCYSVREAGKLIDKLLHVEQWGEFLKDFISKLPPPTEKPRRQGWLNLPPPEPLPLPPDLPPELAEFKRWARGTFQRGEMTIEQLFALQDERFGKLIF